jgi:hypothetical protein
VAKSGSGKPQAAGVSRWLILAPLVVSLVALQSPLWEWDWCDVADSGLCRRATALLSWVAAGFPHVLAYPLAMVLPDGLSILGVLLGIDLAVAWAVWRFLPRSIDWRQVAIGWGVWGAMTAATVFAAPYLIAILWKSNSA